jgi:hypothetical protein
MFLEESRAMKDKECKGFDCRLHANMTAISVLECAVTEHTAYISNCLYLESKFCILFFFTTWAITSLNTTKGNQKRISSNAHHKRFSYMKENKNKKFLVINNTFYRYGKVYIA